MNHEATTLSRRERLTAQAHAKYPEYSFRELNVTLEELGMARKGAPYTAFTRELTDNDRLALALTIEDSCGVKLYRNLLPAHKRNRFRKAFTTTNPTGHVYMGVYDESVVVKDGYIDLKLGTSANLEARHQVLKSGGPGAFTFLATWPSQDHFALEHLVVNAMKHAGFVKARDTREKFLVPAPLVADLQATAGDTAMLGRLLELQLHVGKTDNGFGLGDCVSDAREREFVRKN